LATHDLSASKNFIFEVNKYVIKLGGRQMSSKQQKFISFCIHWMVMLGSLNFAAFALASLGYYGARALSKMLHHSKIEWSWILRSAVTKILIMYNVKSLHIVIDDTDRSRSKTIKALWGVFKTLDKVTKGWIKAQNIVFLCLVTEKITLPFMFSFYRPDPKHSDWCKKDKKLRKSGIAKKDRAPEPRRKKQYPTRITIATNLLRKFKNYTKTIEEVFNVTLKVNSILFDNAYMSPKIIKYCKNTYPGVQIISQIKSSQIVWAKASKAMSVREYFSNKKATQTTIKLRYSNKKVSYISSQLTVKSHGCIFRIIALQYEGEKEYRYLAATELTWRAMDVIKAYTFRWLIEVFNFDWKQKDGWGRKACQQGADGACRGVILSLLVDCFLLSHPLQIRQNRAGLQLYTTGSIVKYIQHENLIKTIEIIFNSADPKNALKTFARNLENSLKLIPSKKHMIGIDLKDFECAASAA
jgi:hypothetical protein